MSEDGKANDPDSMLEEYMGLIRGFAASVKQNPALMADKDVMGNVLKGAEFLRRLNADLKKRFDPEELARLSDEDLDRIEREANEQH